MVTHWLQKKTYSVHFTKSRKTFGLNLHYNRAISYLFVNSTEIIKFTEKDSEIVAISIILLIMPIMPLLPLRLGKIRKDLSVGNMKKTEFYEYVYYFCVDYDGIAVGDI